MPGNLHLRLPPLCLPFKNRMPIDSNLISQLLTPDELADLLKISKSGVYRLIEKRQIPFFKVGGSLRFNKDDIMSYLRRNRFESIGLKNYGNTQIPQ